MLSWQQYLTRLFKSVKLPAEKHDEDVVVGDMHGTDFGGESLVCDVIRNPDGEFRTAYPMRTCERFALPGR